MPLLDLRSLACGVSGHHTSAALLEYECLGKLPSRILETLRIITLKARYAGWLASGARLPPPLRLLCVPAGQCGDVWLGSYCHQGHVSG